MKENNLPQKMAVYHSGRCGSCGRELTTPESIRRGLGKKCAKGVISKSVLRNKKIQALLED